MTRRGVILALSLLAAPLFAAEKPAPEVSRQRATSRPSEISNRPLFIYTVRGRFDPFLPGDLQKRKVEVNSRNVDISDLILAGFTEIDGLTTALFKHRNSLRTFSLKSGRLFSPDNTQITDIQGRVASDRRVTLRQGDRQLVFSNFVKP
jgi:hypothetical protein